MIYLLPSPQRPTNPIMIMRDFLGSKRGRYSLASLLIFILLILTMTFWLAPAKRLVEPLVSPLRPLQAIKSSHEIFGFAPHWTLDQLDNVDFNLLTTFAYFGIEVGSDGDLVKDIGYETFHSDQVTELFKKAHFSGTRVVLTLTQMSNQTILAILDSSETQEKAISQAVEEVRRRGIDGINVDFEYSGDPGEEYRQKFTQFVAKLTDQIHQQNPNSKVTVSVYASAVKELKIYDIASLARVTDGIFMMAYDFAVAGSKNAIPTAPLFGRETPRKYWYDIASAVNDFLKVMPADKLILGVPYYGYNYLVYEPEVKAETRPLYSWRGRPKAQTYSIVQDHIKPDMEGIDSFIEGRDPDSKVPFKAYHIAETDTWRMVFTDDRESLALKYDFAKNKNLKGVGIWALGFDEGKKELWNLLAEKFGNNLTANR